MFAEAINKVNLSTGAVKYLMWNETSFQTPSKPVVLNQDDFVPQKTSGNAGGTFGFYSESGGCYWLVSSKQRFGRLLNNLQCYDVQNSLPRQRIIQW